MRLAAWIAALGATLLPLDLSPLGAGDPPARNEEEGSVSGSLFAMNDIPCLLSALPGDPQLSERQRERLRQVDLHGASDWSIFD